MSELTKYDEHCAYTLNLGDADFMHQYVVDAYAAQTATANDKPIRLYFALVGLFLHCEIGLNGRKVQRAHVRLAATKQIWPTFELPNERGDYGPAEIMRAEPGEQRDILIDRWLRPFGPPIAINETRSCRR
jgi:hypothetical protein